MKVSVIIPNYNNQPLLAKCINSVRHQTHPDWECIIVDDGSADGSADTIAKIVGTDRRFWFIRKETNQGLPRSRNTGIKASEGDALYFLDSDDWIEPYALTDLVGEAQVHKEAGRIFSPDYIEWKSRGWYFAHDVRPLGLLAPDSPYPFASRDCDLGHSTGCLYIKDRLPCEIEFPEIKLFEDLVMNIGLIFAGVSTFVMKKPHYHYVRRDDSLLSYNLTKIQADQIRQALKDLATKYNPNQELYDRCMRFLNNAIGGRVKQQ